MNRYKLYIIDFDGTLIDSYEGLPIFYRHAFGKLGYDVSDEEAYYFAKISLQQAFKEKINKPELEEEFSNACYEIVNTGVLLPHNKLYNDAEHFIKFIKDNNLDCTLVTGNAHVHVNMVLNNLKINDFLKLIITSEDLKNQKPDPEGILLTLDKLHYQGDKKEVCYIGDSINDYLAAKNAGVTPILVDRFNEYSHIEDAILIHSLDELFS